MKRADYKVPHSGLRGGRPPTMVLHVAAKAR